MRHGKSPQIIGLASFCCWASNPFPSGEEQDESVFRIPNHAHGSFTRPMNSLRQKYVLIVGLR